MKAPQILLIVLAFALGLGVMAAINSKKNDAVNDKQALAQSQESTAAGNTGTGIPAPSTTANTQKPVEKLSALPDPAAGDGNNDDQDGDINPEEAIAQLFNSPEARSLMKQFAGAMTRGADRFIEGAVDDYTEKLNLTDAQAGSIKAKMASLMEDSSKKFQSELDDDSRSMQEIMESQGDFWRNNEEEIEGILKEELSAEQFESLNANNSRRIPRECKGGLTGSWVNWTRLLNLVKPRKTRYLESWSANPTTMMRRWPLRVLKQIFRMQPSLRM